MTRFLDAVALVVCALTGGAIGGAWVGCLWRGSPPLKFVAWAALIVLVLGWAFGRARDWERRRDEQRWREIH